MLLGIYRLVGGITVGICLCVLLSYAIGAARQRWRDWRSK